VVVRALRADGFAAWDEFVSQSPEGTFFHTTAWMKAVEAAFGHRAIYLCAYRQGEVVGALPLAHVRSLLGGSMLVSVPYAVYGGIIADDDAARDALVAAARDEMTRTRARCVDLRSEQAAVEDVPVDEAYVTFRRCLPDTPEEVLGWLPRKARAAARNARNKFGLTVEFDDGHLPVVWRLYAQSMRRLASINYPYRFFASLVENSPGQHIVSLVRHEGVPVGGLVTFLHKGVALPYFVGCDARYNRYSVNNFIYLTAMEQAVALGCRVFDFGRSRRDNTGCCDFKRFHGFEPQALEYQRVVAPGQTPPDLTPSNPRFGLARRIWPKLPLCVTRPMGAWVAKHVPG
jgi:FemAB-related protein (PEP-CTERM system-associated)